MSDLGQYASSAGAAIDVGRYDDLIPGEAKSSSPPANRYTDLTQPKPPPPAASSAAPAAPQDPDLGRYADIPIEKPGILKTATQAFGKGAVAAFRDIAHAPTAFADAPPEPPDTSPTGQLLDRGFFESIADPKWYVAQIAHGAGGMVPMAAAGAAGAGVGAGIGAAGGPVGAAGGATIGFVGAAAASALRPAFEKARASGLEWNDAVRQSILVSGLAGGIAGIMPAASRVAMFGTKPIMDAAGNLTADAAGQIVRHVEHPVSEALAQVLGVQPGLMTAQTAGTAAIEGRAPTADELAKGYIAGAGGGAVFTAAHGAGARLLRGNPPATPAETPPEAAQLLLPPPASPTIPMYGPDGAPRPTLALPPPQPLDAAGRAQIYRTTSDAGEDALGPRTAEANQFVMRNQVAPLALVSKYENPSGNPLLGWGNTDLSGYRLSDTGFPDWPGKPGPKGISTAAGLWQITRSTWDPIARQLGIHDFSEESQRKVAEELYRTRGMEPWAPHNPALAAAIARGEVADLPGRAAAAEPLALPPPLLRLPRPGTTYGDDFLMTASKPEEAQKLLPAPTTTYGEGFTAGAQPVTGTPFDRALYAVSQLNPGDPVTRRFLARLSGLASQDQVARLRDRLVGQGLIASANGRYTRAATVNRPEVFAPQTIDPLVNRIPATISPPIAEPALPASPLPEVGALHPASSAAAPGISREPPAAPPRETPAEPTAPRIENPLDAAAATTASTPPPPPVATVVHAAEDQTARVLLEEAKARRVERESTRDENGWLPEAPANAMHPVSEPELPDTSAVAAIAPPRWTPTDLGPPAIEPRASRVSQAAPTTAALNASLNRADATRNQPRLSPEQASVAEGTRAEMARRFEEAVTEVAQSRATETPTEWRQRAETAAIGHFPNMPGKPPSPVRRAERLGFMDAIKGAKEGLANLPANLSRHYFAGHKDGIKWIAENPRPDVGTVEVRVPHGRGGETVLTLPRDEQIIQRVAEQYSKLPAHALYQRPGASSDTPPAAPVDRAALRDELYRIVKERAPTLRLRTFDDMTGTIEGRASPIHGSYHTEARPGGLLDNIASIALGGPAPRSALSHEIVHFLRSAGLFTRDEWGILSGKADKWTDQFGINERYPEVSPGIRREEAIAEAYAAWDRGDIPQPPGLRRIFGKLKDFFDRTANWLRGQGFQTAEDVFGRMSAGEVGARPGEARPTDALHARPPRTPEQADLDRIMARDTRTLGERARGFIDSIRTDAGTRFKQAFLDDTAGLERAERGATGGRMRDASVSPTIMARLTRNLDTVMSTVIGLRHGAGFVGGALRYDPRSGAFETALGSKPFAAIFKPIFDAGKQDLWALWAITNRAKRLMAEGRENNVPADMIAKYSTLDRQHPEFRQVMTEWRDLNKRTLDLAEQTGILNAASRALFEKEDYVPFFRALDDDQVGGGGKAAKGIANIRSGFRTLTGGEEKIANIYENMVRNLSSIVDRSMKNEAMRRTVSTLSGTDALTKENAYVPRMNFKSPEVQEKVRRMIGFDPDLMTNREEAAARELIGMVLKNDPGIVSVMENGKPQYYRVNDPLLLRSLVSMGPQAADGIIKTLMGGAKKVLTHSVTIDPAFMAANLMRDAVHSWVVTGHSFTPGVSTAKGFVDALRRSPSAMALMAGGAGGGHFYAAAPERVRAMLESQGFKDSLLNSPVKLWRALERIGAASEQANRIAIYDAALKEGTTKAEAIARAQDMLNFTMRGDNSAMRFLIETVPFLNARVQGLYRLGRGARDNPASFLLRGGLVTAASIALWAANHDDERYKALEDWDRQNYHHFFVGDQHFRLPQAFEVGAIFSSIPTMMLDYADNGRSKQIRDAFVAMVSNQLQLDPTPQLLKPALDLYANKDSFTGRPIVNEAESRLTPEMRYGPQTSATMIGLGGELGISPDQAEHLVRGYGGTVATYLLAASDSLASAVGLTAPQASKRLDQLPVIQRFVREEPALATRWLTEFYDLKQQTDQLVGSLHKHQQEGNAAAAAKLATDNAALLGLHSSAAAIGQQLSLIRRSMAQVQSSRTMAPDDKRVQLDQLIAARNRIATAARPMIQRAEGLTSAP